MKVYLLWLGLIATLSCSRLVGQDIVWVEGIGKYANGKTLRHSYQKWTSDSLLLEEMYLLDYKDTTQKNFYQYTYNNEKKLVSKHGYEKTPQNKVFYAYVIEPKLQIITEMRSKDTLTHYTYWGKGNRKPLILLEKRTHQHGKTLEKTEYSYSPLDSLLLETITQRLRDKMRTKKNFHQYNPQTFQKTEVRCLDFNNHLSNQIFYKYDTQNRLVEIRDRQQVKSYQYKDNNLHSITVSFLANNKKQITIFLQGRIIEQQFFEGSTLAYSIKYTYSLQ